MPSARKGESRTAARLVATREQNPPLDGLDGVGRDGLVESLLPVVLGEDVELHGAELGLEGRDGIVDAKVQLGTDAVEHDLESAHSLVQHALLGNRKSGQSCRDCSEREPHDDE